MSFDLDHYIETYEVHPETVAFLKSRSTSGARAYEEVGVEEARENALQTAKKYGGHFEFRGKENEIVVPASSLTDDIPVTVYIPDVCGQTSYPLPLLVYFHGGGNVTKCRKTHETVCRILASKTPCIVLNVEYRLAPEHKFPANHHDAKRVVEWTAENKTLVGGTKDSKLGVAGDSAGGYISAVVCHETKSLIDFALRYVAGNL
ncbi:alpha/beta hydrolase fold [Mactra antiquata]